MGSPTVADEPVQLRRADVLTGALELLDAEGLDRLTMRRLATHLGVRHGGLYWHFSDKQALLNAMAEQIFAGAGDVAGTEDPFDQLTALAHRQREALLSHRDGARVVAGTKVSEPNTLRLGDLTVRAAVAAGATPEQAVLTMCTLQEFILGHVMEEQGEESPAEPTEPAEPPGQDGSSPDRDLYPHLADAIDHLTFDPRGGEAFAHGLGLILGGLRSLCASRVPADTGGPAVATRQTPRGSAG